MSAREPSYFRDPNAVEDHPIKSYGCHEVIIDTCREHGLKVVMDRPDANDSFIVIHVIATWNKYRAARFQWLARMTVGGEPKPAELFA